MSSFTGMPAVVPIEKAFCILDAWVLKLRTLSNFSARIFSSLLAVRVRVDDVNGQHVLKG